MVDVPIPDSHDARSEILARIRSANLGTATNAQILNPEEAWQSIPRNYRETGTLAKEERIHLFAERLRDYGVGVYFSQQDIAGDTIAEILRTKNKQRILVPLEIRTEWLRHSGCTFVPDDGLSYAEIEACDGVLTGCTTAIALTGTLVLCHGAGQARRVLTLLPDYHLCVVEADAIVETVPEAICALQRNRLQPLTFISGPSATADIEMTRIQGVHGPRVLDVVIAS